MKDGQAYEWYRANLAFNLRDDPFSAAIEKAKEQAGLARDCIERLRELHEEEVGGQVDEIERLRRENYRLRMLLRKEE